MMTSATVTQKKKASRAITVWITQVITGLLLIIVLTLHMISHHFIVEGGLRNYQQVLAYVQNPLIFVLELVFVVIATGHALLGVRAVILDIGLSERAKRTLNWVLAIIGAITLVYGIWLAFALQQL
jgi:succinate dehydrogenase / fumarate reductase membrane anchor subunit